MHPQTDHARKTAAEYRQTADEHVRTLKDFWKDFLVSGLFVLAALVIIIACLAWFAANNSVNSTSSALSAKGARYIITAEGSNKGAYDQSGHSTGQLDITDSMDVSISSNFNNETASLANRLGPGSRGSLTFYVQWLEGEPQNVDVDIIRSISVTTTDVQAQIEDFKNLLTGHVLFFKNRDGSGYYSDWVGSTYTVSAADFKAAENYKVKCTLYWVWPELFRNYVFPGNPTYNQGLFSSNVSNGYADLLKDVNENHAHYFKSGVTGLTVSSDMSAADLQTCTNSYNEADETLGKSVNYFQIRLSATAQDEKQASTGGEGN